VIVVGADPVGEPVDGQPATVSLELTILAGDAKGELVALRAAGLGAAGDDPVMLLGLPGTLTVAGGVPNVTLEQ